ncbi:hypothetical protein H8M03_03390 [Sphingomonas sabuli]|uniref:2OG-Fe(II) oxygenase n=1 Tax=Sphingomonas sabuli TaxID=2764186 RepID=A0A7G9L449_9SPHN|nr:hypothetical protein [Sphingomonas sabuli]QNM83398.1 hypothetical protein H8M03_03390 [Sphingomonas sabuli]
MKHFINQDMLAPNVMTVPVDDGIASEFAELAGADDPGTDYHVERPWLKYSDMRWISARTERAFERFESAFDRLDVARHVRDYVDLDKKVRFFTGFLHTRSDCRESNFHVDWKLTNNEAFTLLVPVRGLESGPRLAYKQVTGDVATYDYKRGEAIIFGDHFVHSTPEGLSEPPFTMLVLYFGTDKMEHWGKLLRTQGFQCPLLRRPDGEFLRVDPQKGPSGPGNDVEWTAEAPKPQALGTPGNLSKDSA